MVATRDEERLRLRRQELERRRELGEIPVWLYRALVDGLEAYRKVEDTRSQNNRVSGTH